MNQGFPKNWIVRVLRRSYVHRIRNWFILKNFFWFNFDQWMGLVSIMIPNLQNLIEIIGKCDTLSAFFLSYIRSFTWIYYKSNQQVFQIFTIFLGVYVKNVTFKSAKSLFFTIFL